MSRNPELAGVRISICSAKSRHAIFPEPRALSSRDEHQSFTGSEKRFGMLRPESGYRKNNSDCTNSTASTR